MTKPEQQIWFFQRDPVESELQTHPSNNFALSANWCPFNQSQNMISFWASIPENIFTMLLSLDPQISLVTDAFDGSATPVEAPPQLGATVWPP